MSRRSFDRSIVEGPIGPAVWKLAWPTMLQNVIGGLQGLVDHMMVGHYVGYTGNAAIGVSWQIFLVVQVFIGSLFTGMGVLVARFAGRNEPEVVNRVVYQAFLTAAMAIVSPSRQTGTRSSDGSEVSNWYMKLVSLSGSQTTWVKPFFLSSSTMAAGCSTASCVVI